MADWGLPTTCPFCGSKRKFSLTKGLALYECRSTYNIKLLENGMKEIKFKKCKQENKEETT